MQNLLLYTYFRSGSSHRVRIALALKGIAYDSVPVHLLRDGGEHLKPAYRAVNPQARLPALVLPGGEVLIQSPAILEYLEETVPHPPLLPADPVARARVRGVAAIIGCDIHPLNNVATLSTLRRLGQDEAAVSAWISRWITEGFEAVEQLIGQDGWCFGADPGLADVYLVPQLFSAHRFKVPLDHFPRIRRIAGLSDAHPAFAAAAPESQPDAP
jgi:maleylacetoacetate isomerase/maleylpyruvate isomerase